MIRVMLADDQAMVRGALAALLALETDIEVVAQVDVALQDLAPADAEERLLGPLTEPVERAAGHERGEVSQARAEDLT